MPGAKKEKDPNMPKRPLTPYFAFSADERPKVRAEHPDWKVTEVAKELGRRYICSLDTSRKVIFPSQAKRFSIYFKVKKINACTEGKKLQV